MDGELPSMSHLGARPELMAYPRVVCEPDSPPDIRVDGGVCKKKHFLSYPLELGRSVLDPKRFSTV